MNIFVINLKNDQERRATIQKQADSLGLKVEFIEAINGKLLTEEQINELSQDFYLNGMTHGVLGCSLSHLKVYEKIVSEKIAMALILEDDAKLSENIKIIYDRVGEYNEKHRDNSLVYLLSQVNEYIDTFKKHLYKNYFLVNVIDADYAYGYIINNVAAKNLLQYLYPVRLEADAWRFMQQRNIVKLKAVIPPAIMLTRHCEQSTLEEERAILLQKRISFYNEQYKKRSFYIKVRMALWRIFVRPWVKRIRP
ncbi:glycosyltransferase family 25 protein [Proteus cibi]|uniref:glycosyltransferase family 25 protein n=1 Tax=Proteus cibi TaxID=2050966 RepID=UPI0032D9F2D6